MFRRVSRNIFSLTHFLKKFSRSFSQQYRDLPSALFICNENRSQVFAALDPHIELCDGIKEELIHSVECRGIKNCDVRDLAVQGKSLKKITTNIKSLSSDISHINVELKKINDQTEGTRKEMLENELEEAKSKLEGLRKQVVELETTFAIPFLQLPNILHRNTSKEDECIFSLFDKPSFDFSPKSHCKIGLSLDQLTFNNVSPSSFYLTGHLALLEFALSDFFLNRLKENGFRNLSGTDVVRAVLAEGCGLHLKDSAEALRVMDSSSYNLAPFLVGNSTISSFVSYFCKGVIDFKDKKTIRLVSAGRKYSRIQDSTLDQPNLFNTIQSSCVSAFIVSPQKVPEESLFSEMALLATQIYTELGLHFRLVQYGASKLKSHESYAVGICIYSPYYKEYIEVGRISLHNNFISKRLQILGLLKRKEASFVNMLFFEIADLTKLIGVLIENKQDGNGGYSVPECLETYLSV